MTFVCGAPSLSRNYNNTNRCLIITYKCEICGILTVLYPLNTCILPRRDTALTNINPQLLRMLRVSGNAASSRVSVWWILLSDVLSRKCVARCRI